MRLEYTRAAVRSIVWCMHHVSVCSTLCCALSTVWLRLPFPFPSPSLLFSRPAAEKDSRKPPSDNRRKNSTGDVHVCGCSVPWHGCLAWSQVGAARDGSALALSNRRADAEGEGATRRERKTQSTTHTQRGHTQHRSDTQGGMQTHTVRTGLRARFAAVLHALPSGCAQCGRGCCPHCEDRAPL
jgi:hypothetical protein